MLSSFSFQAALSYLSGTYIVLAFTSAVTNLPNKTLILYDFPGPKIKFRGFPGL